VFYQNRFLTAFEYVPYRLEENVHESMFFLKIINNNLSLYSVEKNVQELEQIYTYFFPKKITFVHAGTGSSRTGANSVQRPPEFRGVIIFSF
jgi:hypothetical protein